MVVRAVGVGVVAVDAVDVAVGRQQTMTKPSRVPSPKTPPPGL